MRRLLVASIVLATVVLITTIARAEPPGLTIATPITPAPWSSIQSIDTGVAALAPAPPAENTKSYRWQIVLADAGSLLAGLFAPALGVRDDGAIAMIYGGTYALGAPVVHAVNGHPWRAAGSVALRVALPYLGVQIGHALQGEPDCPPDANLCGDAVVEWGLIFGITGGALTAIVIDTWLLAKPTTRSAKRGWSPTAAPASGGATVGVSGWF